MDRFSQMNRDELIQETERLRQEADQKLRAGRFYEVNVLEQQYYFAKSYLVNPKHIVPGTVYHIHGEAGVFKVTYINGVMAWGYLNNEEPERAFPLGRLYQPDY
ncbi:DUF1811 family protein [Numidum massiliense]|uniref:DUF1811 family protein n=1 Tax=Numidum massiliense TaxID=1522315 RepID=UPI0006D5ABC1|nr:DUF1811 family protein [Numidum massiliense]